MPGVARVSFINLAGSLILLSVSFFGSPGGSCIAAERLSSIDCRRPRRNGRRWLLVPLFTPWCVERYIGMRVLVVLVGKSFVENSKLLRFFRPRQFIVIGVGVGTLLAAQYMEAFVSYMTISQTYGSCPCDPCLRQFLCTACRSF